MALLKFCAWLFIGLVAIQFITELVDHFIAAYHDRRAGRRGANR